MLYGTLDMRPDTPKEWMINAAFVSQGYAPVATERSVELYKMLAVTVMMGVTVGNALTRLSYRATNEFTALQANVLYEALLGAPLDADGRLLAALRTGCNVHNTYLLQGQSRIEPPTSLHDQRLRQRGAAGPLFAAPNTISGVSVQGILNLANMTGDPVTVQNVNQLVFMHFNGVVARQKISGYVEQALGSKTLLVMEAIFTFAAFAPDATAYATACALWAASQTGVSPKFVVHPTMKEQYTPPDNHAKILVKELEGISKMSWEFPKEKGAVFRNIMFGTRASHCWRD